MHKLYIYVPWVHMRCVFSSIILITPSITNLHQCKHYGSLRFMDTSMCLKKHIEIKGNYFVTPFVCIHTLQ